MTFSPKKLDSWDLLGYTATSEMKILIGSDYPSRNATDYYEKWLVKLPLVFLMLLKLITLGDLTLSLSSSFVGSKLTTS